MVWFKSRTSAECAVVAGIEGETVAGTAMLIEIASDGFFLKCAQHPRAGGGGQRGDLGCGLVVALSRTMPEEPGIHGVRVGCSYNDIIR